MKKSLILISHLILIFISFLIITGIKTKLLLQHIAIAYGLDNNYRYPTLVSIVSILENAGDNTFYTFYLLVEKKTFKEENKKLFYNLENKYVKCKVIIIEMDESMLNNARTDRYPMPTYYRLSLALLIPDINRVIYLDGDTIVFKDLTEMINLKMNDNIVMGFVDNSYKTAEPFGIKTYKYVTGGVLLMNLRKIRVENFTQKFFDFMENNSKKLTQEDQTVINVVLHGRIDLLPPKYGIWNFRDNNAAKRHNEYENQKLGIKAYEEKKLLEAMKDPSVVHFVRGKPWDQKDTKHANPKFSEKWWEYAKKTDEYKNIIKFYGFKKEN